MTNAIIYTRFSPRPDAATSESCAVQGGECEQYAYNHKYNVVETIDDPDASGADEFREKLWEAISKLKKGWVLLVYKRDRLARDVYLSETINRAVSKKGARIEAVTGDVNGEGPEQTMIRQVVAVMAEYERKIISQRTSSALLHYQREGKRVSCRPPFGFAVDPNDRSRLVRDEKEQATLAEIMRLYGEGCGFREIVRRLPPESARCGKWEASTIRHIIKRESKH